MWDEARRNGGLALEKRKDDLHFEHNSIKWSMRQSDLNVVKNVFFITIFIYK